MTQAYPESGTLDLEERDNKEEQPDDDRRLDAERLQRAVLRRPRDLEVRDTETAERTREVDQRGDFALPAREAVVAIRVWWVERYSVSCGSHEVDENVPYRWRQC